MVRITNGSNEKYVTNGAYENFYKRLGYNIKNESKVEVEKPKQEVKKEEVVEIKINEDKENKKSPETKEFKKR